MKAIIISLLSVFIATGIQAQEYYTNGVLLDGGDSVRFTCTVEQSRGQTYVTLKTGSAEDYTPIRYDGYAKDYSVFFQWDFFESIVENTFTIEQLEGIPSESLFNCDFIGDRTGKIVYMEIWFALNDRTAKIPPTVWGKLFQKLQNNVKFVFSDFNNTLLPESPEGYYYRTGDSGIGLVRLFDFNIILSNLRKHQTGR